MATLNIGEIVVDCVITVAPGDSLSLFVSDASVASGTTIVMDILGSSLVVSSVGGVQGPTGIQGPTGTVGPAISPATLSSAPIWAYYESRNGVVVSGGKVTQWQDLSGNFRHMNQASGSNQGTVATAVLNNLNAISFGNGGYMQSTGTLSQVVSYIAVVEPTMGTTSTNDVIISGFASSSDIALASDTTPETYLYNGAQLFANPNVEIPSTYFSIITCVFNGNSSRLDIYNTGSTTTGSTSTTGSPNGITLNSLGAGLTRTPTSSKWIALYVFNGALSAVDEANFIAEYITPMLYGANGNINIQNNGTPLGSFSTINLTGILAGVTGPSLGQVTINAANDYFMAGITGYTGCQVGATAASPTGSGMITWNSPILQAGNLKQANTTGTGSSWLNVNAAGIYEVSYNIVATGFPGVAETPQLVWLIQQTLNATGTISGGTQINQSASYLVIPSETISNQFYPLSASKSYIVSLPSGCNIETWMTVIPPIGVGEGSPTGIVLSATGTSFSMSRIG